MFKKRDRNEVRVIRHARVRKKISGTPEMPRLCVYRSLNHIYAQIIDDTKGVTLVSASTMDPAMKGQLDEVDKKGASKLVGKLLGERAVQSGIKAVVFDRGGYVYAGRVADLAAGDNAGPFRSGEHLDAGGAVHADNLVRNVGAVERNIDHLLFGIFRSLANGFGDFHGLTHAAAHAAVLVAHNHQRGEPHVAAALYGLGYAINGNQFLFEFANLLIALHCVHILLY